MDTHQLLGVCKYVSAIAAATFGAIGVFGEPRKAGTGKLTVLGKVAVAGFLVSAATGAATSWFEQRKGAEETEAKRLELADALAWQKKALTTMQRQMYPLNDLLLSVRFKVTPGRPEFAEAANVLNGYLARLPPPQSNFFRDDAAATVVAYRAEGGGVLQPWQVVVNNASPFIREIAGQRHGCFRPQLYFAVLRNPPDLAGGGLADLSKVSELEIAYTPRGYVIEGSTEGITYDIAANTLTYNLHLSVSGGNLIQDKGTIASVLDFANAYALIYANLDPKLCRMEHVQIDVPGPLGKSSTRSARFEPKSVVVDGKAGGVHRFGDEDFALRQSVN